MSHPVVAQLQRGVIVEFDFAVLNGHACLLDICRARLEKEDVKFDAMLMARSMNGRSFSYVINSICSKQGKTVEVPAVVADCNAAFAEKLSESLDKIPASFLKFVKAATAKNMKVVIVTRLDAEAVQAALESVQSDLLVVLHDVPNGFGFNTWEGWRRAARKCNLHDRMCVAVAGSGYSMKGALNSGMFTVAKPNALTEHQDFGGSDISLTDFNTDILDDMTRFLRM